LVGFMESMLANMESILYIHLAMKNRLKVLRAERNWSQQDLAERLGVSRQTINAIEAERYDPSLPLAIRIAKLFGQPVEMIFEGET
jgi:putative transcriptional regulator